MKKVRIEAIIYLLHLLTNGTNCKLAPAEDFAYQFGRFIVHSILGRLTNGLSTIWWLVKNVDWE